MSSRRSPQVAVDAWNARYPLGTPVTVRLDSDRIVSTTTRSRAQVLSGHTAVIWLSAISGCYALDCVQAALPERRHG